MKNQRFIPSQRIKGSDKELFIINYEGSVIEVQRTSNLYEPLIVRLNSKFLGTIPSKQNKEIEFSIAEDKHTIQVWNERVENTLIPKIFMKDGIAIVIDGIPVQNSLADPITKVNGTKSIIWILTILFFIKGFIIPLSYLKEFKDPQHLTILFIYITIFIFSLSAALTFKLNPLRSTWIAFVLSFIELAEFIYTLNTIRNLNIITILLICLRLAIFSYLIFSIHNLRHILNYDQDFIPISKNNYDFQVKTKFKKLFSLKYIAITLVFIFVIYGLYYIINNFINSQKYPSIERYNSLKFKTDLKLPQLIPYRNGVKWGYTNQKGEIIIEPKFLSIEFLSKNDHYKVNYNGLLGIIDNHGKQILPYKYKDIDELSGGNLFIVENSDGAIGLVDGKNKILIPFNYKRLEKHPFSNFYIATKEKVGLIDEKNNIIIPFIYNEIEFCNDFIIAEKKVKDKSYYGLLNFDGSILLNFQSLKLSSNKCLKKDLLIVSTKKRIYINLFSEYKPVIFEGIINTKGKIFLPIEYEDISPIDSSGFMSLKKSNYPFYQSKYGIINSRAEIVVPCKYDYIETYQYQSDGNQKYVIVENNFLKGLIDFNNEIILPTEFEQISIQQHNGEYFCSVKDKWKNKTGLIKLLEGQSYDSNYELILPFYYDEIVVDKNSNWITVWNNNRCGIIDFNNNIVIPIKYNYVFNLSEGFVSAYYVEPDSINKILKSNKIKGITYLDEIHTGLTYGSPWIGINQNPNYKYRNYSTLELANALCDTITRHEFYKQNAKYLRNSNNYEKFCIQIVTLSWNGILGRGKFGYFNEKGEKVIDFIYSEATDFQNGLARVRFNKKWGIINTKGEVVIPIKFDDLVKIKGYDLFKIQRNNITLGFVDYNNVEYFKNPTETKSNLLIGKWKLTNLKNIDSTGTTVVNSDSSRWKKIQFTFYDDGTWLEELSNSKEEAGTYVTEGKKLLLNIEGKRLSETNFVQLTYTFTSVNKLKLMGSYNYQNNKPEQFSIELSKK